VRRLVNAFRALPAERRLAVYAALGLFLALSLPWYSRQFVVLLSGRIVPASDTQSGWQAFSFVEAAVLLVSLGVLVLLFQRAEGRAFHLPGGDGWVITAAGAWTCLLIVWRIFDRQGGSGNGQHFISYGIKWGIFIALAISALLAYAGSRIRAAAQPEPPLPGEGDEDPSWDQPPAPAAAAAQPRRAPERPPAPTPATPDYVVRRRRRIDTSTVPIADPPEFVHDRSARGPARPDAQPPPPARADGEDQLTIPFDSGS
jgi:hypothetical protein